MRLTLFLFLLLLIEATYAQTAAKNFPVIDKRVLLVQSNSIKELSEKLTQPYKTQLEKTRSVFKWITGNIAYDIEGYHNPGDIYAGLFRPEISDIDSVRQKDYNDRIVQKVLTEKKAICDGYSRLFKSLCDIAGIQCVIINGYIRWQSDPAGVTTTRRHAWNAVYLNNKWQLLDATWASGYCNDSTTKFYRKYDDFYFLTDPVKMFNDHFPDDPQWSLLPRTPSRAQFYGYPFFNHDFFSAGILSIRPVNGLIELSVTNKRVRIEIETSGRPKNLEVIEYPFTPGTANVIDTLPGETYIPQYKIERGKIYWDYVIKSTQTNRLDIYYNDKLVLTYSVRFYQ